MSASIVPPLTPQIAGIQRGTIGPISTTGLDNPSTKLYDLSASPQISPIRGTSTTGSITPLVPLQIQTDIRPASIRPASIPISPVPVVPTVTTIPTIPTVTPIAAPIPITATPRQVSATPRIIPILTPPVTATPRAVPAVPTVPAVVPITPSPILAPTVVPITPSIVPIAPTRVSPSLTVVPIAPTRVSPTRVSPTRVSPTRVSPAPTVVPITPSIPATVMTISPSVTPISPISLEVPIKDVIVSPVDTKTLEFQVPGMTDQTVEKKIISLGFMPIVKTTTRKPNGTLEARYIKAVDSKGNISYIHLNVDSNVSVLPTDLTTVESVDANNVPYTVKTGAISTVGLGVSGVAFECQNGICTLSQDSPDKPRTESFLTYIEKPRNAVIVEDDSPIAYPIVKLSDVLENPTLITQLIDRATKSLRDQAYALEMRALVSADNVFKETMSKGRVTLRAINIAMNHIMESLTSLEDTRKTYDFNAATTPEAMVTYELLVYNIKYRQDKLKELLVLSREVSAYVEECGKLSASFDNLNKELDARFGGIRSAIYNPVK